MITLPGRVFLAVGFFPCRTLNISRHSLLACKVSAEKSADSLMGFPLYVTCCLSLAALRILCLSLILDILIIMCLGVGLSGFILFHAPYLDGYFLP